MSKNFDDFKNSTYATLKTTISGDVNVVLGIIETLLQAQAKDLEKTFTNQKINDLLKRIDELESQVDELSKQHHLIPSQIFLVFFEFYQ